MTEIQIPSAEILDLLRSLETAVGSLPVVSINFDEAEARLVTGGLELRASTAYEFARAATLSKLMERAEPTWVDRRNRNAIKWGWAVAVAFAPLLEHEAAGFLAAIAPFTEALEHDRAAALDAEHKRSTLSEVQKRIAEQMRGEIVRVQTLLSTLLEAFFPLVACCPQSTARNPFVPSGILEEHISGYNEGRPIIAALNNGERVLELLSRLTLRMGRLSTEAIDTVSSEDLHYSMDALVLRMQFEEIEKDAETMRLLSEALGIDEAAESFRSCVAEAQELDRSYEKVFPLPD